jgi:hypothetical protein
MKVQPDCTDIGAVRELEDFPLVEALFGRRSRRFALGGEIPDGPLAYRSGPGGPFHPGTPGAWTGSPRVRGSAQIHDQAFKACVARQAQYVFDTFGKFPGTVPSVFIMNYVQAHHLDLDFYDRFFKPGAYLRTHADHMRRWHHEASDGLAESAGPRGD